MLSVAGIGKEFYLHFRISHHQEFIHLSGIKSSGLYSKELAPVSLELLIGQQTCAFPLLSTTFESSSTRNHGLLRKHPGKCLGKALIYTPINFSRKRNYPGVRFVAHEQLWFHGRRRFSWELSLGFGSHSWLSFMATQGGNCSHFSLE